MGSIVKRREVTGRQGNERGGVAAEG